ncbi:SDR family oxidoreductase [Actinoallomurus bryophytorum]|uniref:Thioester reductase-like protein n=1 Tax=Actinoallomurus bryophytorum TaxID=1490222 RepID=A0A543CJ09_9ACTN|nr:SDR family oxidoreductase [Actinoallomurus bryophytorum]TQL97078.1 thioester reductase-like protein [Actinoallomurus bryophytorum]
MTVVITGGTGFTGTFLLRSMLARDPGEVVVLSRDEPGRAHGRLLRALDALAAPSAVRQAARRQVTAVQADITRPGLGLPADRFAALAASMTELWHCAADTTLNADPASLRRVNLGGTQNVLALAEAAPPGARVRHLSTAFVAGRRREGLILEDELDDSAGFENDYERSKYDAEVAVRDWSSRTGRPVLVLRPSLMVHDRPAPAGVPDHQIGSLVSLLARMRAVHRRPGREPLTVRLPGRPDARLNMVQVGWAAEAMLEASARIAGRPAGAVTTLHVVHPQDTPAEKLWRLAAENVPEFRLTLGPAPADPNFLERFAATYFQPFLPFAWHRRSYDRARLVSALPSGHRPGPLSFDFLFAVLDSPRIERPHPASAERRPSR